MIDLIANTVVIFILVTIANFITRSEDGRYRRLFDGFLLAINIPLLAVGMFFVFASDEQLAGMTAVNGEPLFSFVTNSLVLGIVLQVTAVWGIVFSFRSTRAHLARHLPLNPDSSVHTLALLCAGWLVSTSLIQLTQVSLEQMGELIGELSIPSIVVQQLLFVLLSLLGVGLVVRRTPAEVMARLGLERLTLAQLGLGLFWIIVLVVIQALAGAIWMLVNPDQVELVNTINTDMQMGLDTVWEWLFLALAAGIGEEILFRGALQPVFGLWMTSILFAVVHVQYGLFTPATFALLIIALVLGRLRQKHNTTLAIFIHVGYDFVLGMAVLAATAYSSVDLQGF